MAILTFQYMVFSIVCVPADKLYFCYINFIFGCETSHWAGRFEMFVANFILDIVGMATFSGFYYGFPMDHFIV